MSVHEATPDRPAAAGWARLWPTAHPNTRPMLRHGAWYRVVGEASAQRLVLSVGERRVAVPRHYVELRDERPRRFTVVINPIGSRNPAVGTRANVGRIYGVCPSCGTRVSLKARQERAACRNCGHRGEVAWWETG